MITFIKNHVIQGGDYNGSYLQGSQLDCNKEMTDYLILIGVGVQEKKTKLKDED